MRIELTAQGGQCCDVSVRRVMSRMCSGLNVNNISDMSESDQKRVILATLETLATLRKSGHY